MDGAIDDESNNMDDDEEDGVHQVEEESESTSNDASAIKRIENILSEHLKKLNLLTDAGPKTAEKETVDHEVESIVLKLKSCRSMEDLCIFGGFSMYIGQQKVICALCDDASDNVTKKAGEFSYDFEETGVNFNDCNMPRKFRAFKERIINHLKTKAHKEAAEKQLDLDNKDASNELYNYKVGMKLGSIVYQNLKERCSYAKYERDVAAAALNGDEIGNINHGEGFAKDLVDDMNTKMTKHNKDIHKGEFNQFGDQVISFSSIKIVHGICKEEKLYMGKEKFLSLALKIFCKTPNESVIECIGSVAELHTQPQRNCNFKKFETELMVDWNCPNLAKAKLFIEKSLDRHFGSRKKWNFKTGSSKFFISQVVDRINSQPSRLSFME